MCLILIEFTLSLLQRRYGQKFWPPPPTSPHGNPTSRTTTHKILRWKSIFYEIYCFHNDVSKESSFLWYSTLSFGKYLPHDSNAIERPGIIYQTTRPCSLLLWDDTEAIILRHEDSKLRNHKSFTAVYEFWYSEHQIKEYKWEGHASHVCQQHIEASGEERRKKHTVWETWAWRREWY
jgi:hypothetical protein